MNHPTKIIVVIFSVYFLFSFQKVRSQNEPSADQILKNITDRFNQVSDYTADISAEVNFEKMRIPKMEAKVYFKRPDKIHFEPKSGSFAMFPKDAVAFNPTELIKDRFDAVIQGREMLKGINCVKVKLLAKSDTTRMQRLMLYVDPQYWVVKKMSTTPDRGSSAEVTFDHQLIENKYVMPSKITIEMEAPTFGRRRQQDQPQTETKKGSVVVSYSNYKVNTGISDDIFKKESSKK